MSLALSLCQYVLRPRRGGLAQASPSLEAPRLHALETRDLLHQHNRKGKVVIIKARRYKRLVLGFVFCTWNWYDFWRRSCGLPCSWERTHRSGKPLRQTLQEVTEDTEIKELYFTSPVTLSAMQRPAELKSRRCALVRATRAKAKARRESLGQNAKENPRKGHSFLAQIRFWCHILRMAKRSVTDIIWKARLVMALAARCIFAGSRTAMQATRHSTTQRVVVLPDLRTVQWSFTRHNMGILRQNVLGLLVF